MYFQNITHCITLFGTHNNCFQTFSEFGDKELQVILDHFRTVLVDVGVDVEDAETEWTILKKEVLDL